MDWKNKKAAIAAAKQMGPGMTVLKRPELANYNIVLTKHEADRLLNAKVIVRT